MVKFIKISFITVSLANIHAVTVIAFLKFFPVLITPAMILGFFEGYGINKDYEGFEEISPNFFKAVIAAEDAAFFDHNGFDIEAISKAIEYNKKHKDKKRGGSTISMQTAKNTFLWHGRNFIRKGFEAYFTFLIEAVWGKKRILEVYANVIETGEGIYGVQAAARKYFNKDASELSRRQAALIAAEIGRASCRERVCVGV